MSSALNIHVRLRAKPRLGGITSIAGGQTIPERLRDVSQPSRQESAGLNTAFNPSLTTGDRAQAT